MNTHTQQHPSPAQPISALLRTIHSNNNKQARQQLTSALDKLRALKGAK